MQETKCTMTAFYRNLQPWQSRQSQTHNQLVMQPIGICSASNYIYPSTWPSHTPHFRECWPREDVHVAALVLVTHRCPVCVNILRGPNEVNHALASRQENAVTLIGDMAIDKFR